MFGLSLNIFAFNRNIWLIKDNTDNNKDNFNINDTNSNNNDNKSGNDNINNPPNFTKCEADTDTNKLITGNLVERKVVKGIITETKWDSTFPFSQLMMDGYSELYRFDRNRNGGGVLTNVLEDWPSKNLVDHKLLPDIEEFLIELNIGKSKWFLHSLSQSD